MVSHWAVTLQPFNSWNQQLLQIHKRAVMFLQFPHGLCVQEAGMGSCPGSWGSELDTLCHNAWLRIKAH